MSREAWEGFRDAEMPGLVIVSRRRRSSLGSAPANANAAADKRPGESMAGRMRIVATALLVAAAVLVVAPTPAGAKTTVAVNGDVVTITVPIDCAGCKGKKGPDGSDLADYWTKTAETAWNGAFAKYPYCSRYKFQLKVKIKPKGADFKAKAGDHLVQVANPSGGRLAGVGWTGQQEQNPSGQPNQASPDGTRFYDGDHDGIVTEDATPTVITHEIGHAMGLGDDRDTSGDAIPGRDGTVMVGGAKSVTPDTPLTIDKALVDRIGKQLEHLGKIDKCKGVSGSYHYRLEQPTPNGGVQIAEANLAFSLTQKNSTLEGTIEGTTTATLHLPVCESSTVTPGEFRAQLTGKVVKSGGLRLSSGGATASVPTITPCQGGQPGIIGQGMIENFEQSLAQIEPNGKGKWQFKDQQTGCAAPAPCTISHDITARRG
jgi:hypothetical protein